MPNFRQQPLNLKHLIDNITIDFWFFGNFTSMKDIKRKWNVMVDLSIFISNLKNISGVITIDYNQVCKKNFLIW